MHPSLLTIHRDELLRLERSLTREWCLTDGRGGFASSTVLGCPTRRYHGLLNAAFEGTAKRHVFLARWDDVLVVDDHRLALAMARWRGLFAPLGHQALERFELRPWPAWTWRFGDLTIEREQVLTKWTRPGVALTRWSVRGNARPVSLRVRPLLAFREADALTFENGVLDARAAWADDVLRTRPYHGLPELSVRAAAEARFERSATWYRGIEYTADLARGYDGHEDQFSPGEFTLELARDGEAILAASVTDVPSDVEVLWRAECAALEARVTAARAAWPVRASVESATAASRSRASSGKSSASSTSSANSASGSDLGVGSSTATVSSTALVARSSSAVEGGDVELSISLRAALELSADDFLYVDALGRTGVIAGYPWFGEWGRDTAISLPGLTLARGRTQTCVDALSALVPWMRDGLLPNVFDKDADASAYNSVDASLWFALAVHACERAGVPGAEIARRFLPALRTIVECYTRGTRFGIRVDDDGLIVAGGRELNVTWMDARASTGPVTPRDGRPVEIEALWYSLLAHAARLEHAHGDANAARALDERRERVGAAFLARFWLEDEQRLVDVVRDDGVDASIRPNMVIAAALELSPLSREQRAGVVRCARAELVTPRGLRTLAPLDPQYRGRYEGGPDERDSAYHQGTVWPWLSGFYVEASLRAHAGDASECAHLTSFLDGFAPHLAAAGLCTVSEVFDADPPQRAGGTIAQAWSVAELLRAYASIAAARDEQRA